MSEIPLSPETAAAARAAAAEAPPLPKAAVDLLRSLRCPVGRGVDLEEAS